MSLRQRQTTQNNPSKGEGKNEEPQDQFVSEEEKDLSLEQKLDLLDREVRLLYQFCKNSGYQPDEIQKAAAPFLETAKKASRKKLKKRLINVGKIAGVVLILAFTLFYVDPVYRFFCFMTRRTTIKVLPYWDWTRIYDQPCLIENPYYQGHKLTEEDCMVCEGLESIPVEENLTHTAMAETYLKGLTPVIVTDGMDDWERKDQLTVKYLNEIYSTNEAVKDYLCCDFLSNIRVKFGNHRVLLRKIVAGEVSSYFAHWENCFKEAAKLFREIYPRPYFLPPMVELTDTNWIFISSEFKAKAYKSIDTWTSMIMFAQVKGKNKIKLTPKVPCGKTCTSFAETLQEGEILVASHFLWNFSYLPVEDEHENIAIAVGGNYD